MMTVDFEKEYQRLLKDVRQSQILLDAQASYLTRAVEEVKRHLRKMGKETNLD
jgi:hypothetical protein